MYMQSHTSFRPLDMNAMQRYAPSVFADHAHERTSGRYKFISTLEMMECLQDLGWQPVTAQQSNTRLADRREFTKHIVRFRNTMELPMVGDSIPELVLVNSHDGVGSYQFYAGLFRIVCLNGLIVQSCDLGQVRRRHAGNAEQAVIEGTCEVVHDLPRIAAQVDNFQALQLTHQEQTVMAEAAVELRWGDKAPIEPASLLSVRRREDRDNSLWVTFQKLQENLMKGGIRGLNANGQRTHTRAIKAVDATVSLNRALWTMTEKMAELKAA